MRQSKDRSSPPWACMLEALPLPAAVVDAQGQYVYRNKASACDPILAHLKAAYGDPDHSGDDAVRGLALQRRAYREQVIQTRQPVYFEETACDEGRRLLWIYAPMLDPDGRVAEVIMMGCDVTRVYQQAAAVSLHALVEHIGREIQVPLTALIGLTHSLTHELAGPQAERAAQIDQYGRLLLQQLRTLIASAPGNQG